MSFQLRPASKSDVPQLSVLFKYVYIESYGLEGITKEFTNFMSEQFSESRIQTQIGSSAHGLWVMTFNGNPVGILRLDYNKDCPVGNLTACEVNKLYIMDRFSGQGVGRALMEEAERHLKSMGEREVWLWVWAENDKAIGFYHHLDYQDIGTAYLQIEENKYKNIVMSKVL